MHIDNPYIALVCTKDRDTRIIIDMCAEGISGVSFAKTNISNLITLGYDYRNYIIQWAYNEEID